MILNIDNVNLLINTDDMNIVNDIMSGICASNDELYDIDIKKFANFIYFSYYLKIDMPDTQEQLIQQVNDYCEMIDLSDVNNQYYYSCLTNILIHYRNKCTTPLRFNNIKKILNDYISFLKNYTIYYYYFYFTLKHFVKMELAENYIAEDISTFSIYDIIFDSNAI